MTDRVRPANLWLLLLGLSLWIVPIAKAQPPVLERLLVEIWPEYDRPEVLVMYRAELQAGTLLPTQVTFPIPKYIETMHAVAVEQNGALVEVDPTAIELNYDTDRLLLTFPVSSPQFQFEYYDPKLLTQSEQVRRLTFPFTTPYSSEVTRFEVQEPFEAKNFLLTPEAENSFIGRDGLKYNTIQLVNLAAGDKFELSASYERDTNAVSTQNLTGDNSSNLPVASQVPSSSALNFGYLLLGIGVVLLLMSGGSWWWSRRTAPQTGGPRRRPPQASGVKKKATNPRARKTSAASAKDTYFCYRCGTALRSQANFCHSCGAERWQG